MQACFYLTHSARLYVLKAAIDYWIAREAGSLKKFTGGSTVVESPPSLALFSEATVAEKGSTL